MSTCQTWPSRASVYIDTFRAVAKAMMKCRRCHSLARYASSLGRCALGLRLFRAASSASGSPGSGALAFVMPVGVLQAPRGAELRTISHDCEFYESRPGAPGCTARAARRARESPSSSSSSILT